MALSDGIKALILVTFELTGATVTSIEPILARAISPSSVRPSGRLTLPRSYGVYCISSSSTSTRSVRFGNHPVRQRELKREFGACTLEYLFFSREDAKSVARALAGRN